MRHMSARQANDSLARESDVTVLNKNTVYSEYKGFFTSVISTVCLCCFVVWSLVPNLVFERWGFGYLPDKYWSVAIPSYSLMLMLFIYIALALYNTEVKTLPLQDPRTFVDEHAVFPPQEKIAHYVHRAPSGVNDLPITLVNEVLYSDFYESDESLDID